MVFPGKKIGVTKPVYATALTVKVTEFIGFWYPHPTNFTDPCLYNVSRACFPIMKQEFTENVLPLKINISSRNYGQVRQSTSKILFMFGGGKIK